MSKPYSQACENNKAPILAVIRDYFAPGATVLEIGTGTAQHILHFASHLPAVTWQPSDTREGIATVEAGLAGCTLANVLAPVVLDVAMPAWPVGEVDGIFSANTLHIMAAAMLPEFFAGAGRVLRAGGHLLVYGPFSHGGAFTADSNRRFDLWLQARDPASGVRDVETVVALARANGLELVADHAMPANNQLLAWRRQS